MKEDQERVRALLTDTVSLLCKNGLSFQRNLRVQGLIGITLDDDEVFIVQINESLSERSTLDNTDSNNLSDSAVQSRAKVPQPRRSVDRSPSQQVVSETFEDCTKVNVSMNAKSDIEEYEAIPNEDSSLIGQIKSEPVDVLVVEEPGLKMVRRDQHFRKHYKKPFEKRNRFSDFSTNSRRGISNIYTNRFRRLASGNATGVSQTHSINLDNDFSQITPSDNEQVTRYTNISDSFNLSGGPVFRDNSNIYLVEDSSDWDYRSGTSHENSLNRNSTDLRTEQIVHNSHLDASNSGSAYKFAYPTSSNMSTLNLPIFRRPVDSAAKQFVCDYEGCSLAYYERKNLLQHQSLKHGRPSLRAHSKRGFWSPNQC